MTGPTPRSQTFVACAICKQHNTDPSSRCALHTAQFCRVVGFSDTLYKRRAQTDRQTDRQTDVHISTTARIDLFLVALLWPTAAFCPLGERRIVMTVSVCLSVCLSVRKHISALLLKETEYASASRLLNTDRFRRCAMLLKHT